jgi:hypothetical protein
MRSRGTRPERNVGRNFAGEPRDLLSATRSIPSKFPRRQFVTDLLINRRYVLQARSLARPPAPPLSLPSLFNARARN